MQEIFTKRWCYFSTIRSIKNKRIDNRLFKKNSNLCRTTIKKKQEFEKVNLSYKNRWRELKDELIKKLGLTDDEFSYWETAFEANNIQSLIKLDEFSILYASHLNDPETTLQDKELKNQIRKALGI